jgi:hypothetical protein
MTSIKIISTTLAAYICVCLCACSKTERHRYHEDDQKLCGSLYDHIGNGRVWRLTKVLVNGIDSTAAVLANRGGSYGFKIGPEVLQDGGDKFAWTEFFDGLGGSIYYVYVQWAYRTKFPSMLPIAQQPGGNYTPPMYSIALLGMSDYSGNIWSILSLTPSSIKLSGRDTVNNITAVNIYNLK